jgi:phosphoglycolate phosphatase-like HAD superfamily hydrolase
MVPMMVEILRDTGTSESEEELHEISYRFVMELTGKQTIYQMIRLAEEVTKRGGQPKSPSQYKHIYHERLMVRIQSRHDNLRTGSVPAQDMLVPGSDELLAGITAQGVILYLASGTDEHYVREEVALLGLTRYFGEHIYGAVEDYRSFSKAQVIRRILESNQLDPTRLIGFGDGYVEIQNIKTVGGTAVAVASDESGRSGKPDKWKRQRLLGVGADIVVPDFREHENLIDYLWGR